MKNVTRCLACLRRDVEKGDLRALDRLYWLRAQLKGELQSRVGKFARTTIRVRFLLDSLHVLDELEVELCLKMGLPVPSSVADRAAMPLDPTSNGPALPSSALGKKVARLLHKRPSAR